MKKVFMAVTDVLLFVLFLLQFGQGFLGQQLHVVGGFVLCGLLLLHILLNGRRLRESAAGLFGKNGMARTRIGFAVELLMILCFVMMAVTGMANDGIIPVSSPFFFVSLHEFGAALSLAFVGIHLGLQAGGCGVFQTHSGKVFAVVLAAVMLAGGGIGTAVSPFGQWISAPFTTAGAGQFRSGFVNGQNFNSDLPTESGADGSSGTESRYAGRTAGGNTSRTAGSGRNFSQNGETGTPGQFGGNMTLPENGSGNFNSGYGRSRLAGTNSPLVVLQCLAVTALFAGITFLLTIIFSKRKEETPPAQQEMEA